ncbi:hydrogenase maturation protein [Curvibacter fontanus]|uniref:enoyl-CoA hydratase-related protein n=1 Tax=Hydrogenophaga sp. TaxID=1904254 RepID=UPI002723D0E6|nr:enoyl-CoA hydratase-related protein [Hydrogenophaga sp.]MDO9220932.1 enoyl-CoA hydratase-related protein [Thiobacillus sp.]MDP1619600.1 enoyl-CoA hydratase-related protein [bacterium]MDP1936176.1 enoyl-CoA hydratase-related protein [Hylemonella sp.]MDZ4100706.1 enoyl-CoA hydratase-related protein [Hydrogenophaga sp.]
MRILLLCHSFNSLSQRLFTALTALGHQLSVELDISDSVTEEACALFQPELLIAPFLKRRIPEAVWRSVVCLVVHPGPPGDRGPSALDWAVLEQAPQWGVTVLQANADFDAGPVWAHASFDMRSASKGSLYRSEVTQAAVAAVLHAVERFGARGGPLVPSKAVDAASQASLCNNWRPSMPQAARRIDWVRHDTSEILARLRSADGQPGVQDELFGHPCHLFDAHPATGTAPQALAGAAVGAVVAQRDGALLRRTVDGGVWIGQVRLARGCGDGPAFKLPATLAFAAEAATLPVWSVPLERADDEWAELRYREFGPAGARVGCLSFDFYNGAMSTDQCLRLLAALRQVKQRDTRVLLLLGGRDFFSNGIHLNCIEAAAHRPQSSAADESWRNINAMDDLAKELIETTDRLTVSVLRGNAGAGGVFLALTADEVWAHNGAVLNPHYRNMGNLYGSEYWTYLLPKRVGPERAHKIMTSRMPLSAVDAQRLGLVDRCTDTAPDAFEHEVIQPALAMAGACNLKSRILQKQKTRADAEATRPLADYRKEELSRMYRNFYGFDPSFHVARYHFVHKLPHAWTPRHLAVHRP